MLKDVPPGQYAVIVDRRGYFPVVNAPEVRVTVPPKGAVKDVTIRMIVGGAITGRILDTNALALAGATVQAGELGFSHSGKLEMNSRAGFTQTDDRGEYRLRGVRPGTYYVKADVSVWASDSETYYPGVKDMSGAVPLVVREALDTIANFQITPRLKPVMTISGTVTSSIPGVPAGDIQRIFVATPDGESTYYDNRAEDRSNGRFEIRNIFPDVYDLFPEARDKDGKLFTSRTTVEVTDRSIENLALTASPLTETVGRLTLNGEALAGRIKETALRLVTVRGLEPFLLEGPSVNFQQILDTFEGGLKADPDTGIFKIPPLPPGFYKVELNLPAPNVYVEDIRQGVASVYNSGFFVGDPSGQAVEVMLANPGGVVSGAVINARQEPIRGASVVLIPDGPRRADRSRWLNATTGSEGRFAITAIAPGSYKLFAWESVLQFAWFNEEFLRKHEARGQPLIFDKGVSRTVQLTAIPKEPE
jgi:hypothetical protein